MKCNKCGGRSGVVLTQQIPDGTVRRRHCPACGERWYTLQPPEQMLPNWRLTWVQVNRRSTLQGLKPLPDADTSG